MFEWQKLFQWDRFIAPSIVRPFYWLAFVFAILIGLLGILSGLATMATNPFAGLMMVLGSLVGAIAGILFIRIATEFILIVFRINEQLDAIREERRL